ncbi:MAG TPA: oligosaccharide flippase family protein [Geminicoccaceae bacterium]|nr:oligosaccharide flippase family protein [Geminicoccaceae bacterium]
MASSTEAGGTARYLGNVTALVGCKVLGDVAVFLLFVVLSRVYGHAALGIYTFAVALAGTLAAFVDLGLYDHTLRELARGREDRPRYVRASLALRAIGGIGMLLLLSAAGLALDLGPGGVPVLLVIGLQQALATLANGLAAVFGAEERMGIGAGLDALARTAGALASAAAAWLGLGLSAALAPLALAAGVQALLVAMLLLRRGLLPPGAPEAAELRRLARAGVPFLLSDLARRLAIRIDLLVLGFLVAPALVGSYGAAQRIVALVLFVPHFVALALLPRISRIAAERPAELGAVFARSLRLAVLLGLPAGAGLALIAPDLLVLLYGEEFGGSAPILRILAAMVLIESLRSLLATFLTACDLQEWRTSAEWAAALLAIPLQIAAVSLLGLAGAAGALVLAEAALGMAFAARLRPLLGWPPVGRQVVAAASGAAAFWLAVAWLPALPLPVMVPLAALVYLLVVAAQPAAWHHEVRLLWPGRN